MLKFNYRKKYLETFNNLKMSWKFIKKYKFKIILIVFFSFILSIIGAIIPALSATLLMKLTNELYFELIKYALFIFFVEISRNIISIIISKITDRYMINAIIDVQIKMIEETLKIETSEIDKNNSGTFIDRINNDTKDITNIFSNLIKHFVDFISNIGILISVLIINKYMFFYFVMVMIIINIVNKKRRNFYYNEEKKYRSILEKRTALGTEIIRGIRDIKLLCAENEIVNKTKIQLRQIAKDKISMEKGLDKFRLISDNIRDLFDVIFIVLGVILVNYNNLSPSGFLILYTYRIRIEDLLSFYDRLVEIIKSYNVSATRIFEILENYFKKENDTGININNIKGKIEFKNVYFSYEKDYILKNINFTIMPGEKIGFVGVSGSGKSTIFNLICKLYKIQKGNILIDDMDISKISYKSLRNNISLISQNPYIFNFSIKDNLLIGNNKVSEDEIIDACKKADIYDKILNLENGFDTLLGESGIVLSGGEKQRLAIARSLIKKSNVILFDEATSSLDNISQKKVQNSIYGLDKNKTVLIIAHRLSTVINCDRLIVVDNGKILDVGTHEELLKRCKKYSRLFKLEK